MRTSPPRDGETILVDLGGQIGRDADTRFLRPWWAEHVDDGQLARLALKAGPTSDVPPISADDHEAVRVLGRYGAPLES